MSQPTMQEVLSPKRAAKASASGGTSDSEEDPDVSTWSALQEKTGELADKVNNEPDALDAHTSQTTLTACLRAADQLGKKFKPAGRGEDAAWQKEPGKVKGWRGVA